MTFGEGADKEGVVMIGVYMKGTWAGTVAGATILVVMCILHSA